MAPILDWCASPAWQDASAWTETPPPYYCVHDLGVYPVAAGRVPGNGEQMPIEESAGMLIMAAAYARAVGASAAAAVPRPVAAAVDPVGRLSDDPGADAEHAAKYR